MSLPETTERILRRIEACGVSRVLVAIDGRCASGKTTLAQGIADRLSCTVFHMDDYFLPPQMRTAERLAEPGGNVDRERFLSEVLAPLARGDESITYRPYRCAEGALDAPITVRPTRVTLIEGSYSCHPALRALYDLRIFLQITPEEQLRRLAKRNPEKLAMFQSRWIPLEEAYFSACSVPSCCDLCIDW